MERLENPFAGREGYNCFGCCPDNPIGLRLTFTKDGDTVVSCWEPDDNYQGWHNILHGGIQASLIDEIGSWFVMSIKGMGGVTSRLELKYRKAVLMDKGKIRMEARLLGERRNVVDVGIRLYDGEGMFCTEGHASYFVYKKAKTEEDEHFTAG